MEAGLRQAGAGWVEKPSTVREGGSRSEGTVPRGRAGHLSSVRAPSAAATELHPFSVRELRAERVVGTDSEASFILCFLS